MALTKTTTIRAIRYAAESQRSLGQPMDEPHAIWIETQVVIDDPDVTNDPHLPMQSFNTYRLYQDSDVSQEPEIIQDIWNIIFVKHGLSSASTFKKIGPDYTPLGVLGATGATGA